MLNSFNKSTRLYTSTMHSHILPISISNPFLPNPSPTTSTPVLPISAQSHAGSVFMNSADYDGDDLLHSSIEDGKKFESSPFLPRVSSYDSAGSDATLLASASTSSVSYQQRRRRAASDSNLPDLRAGRRRFFWNGAGRTDGDKVFVARFGAKMLGYVRSGFRIVMGFLSLQCYAFLIMPGVLQVAYYYYFSSQIRRDIVFGDLPRNKLDIYLPKTDGKNNGPKPVIAFITGGAWVIGYKAWGSLLGRHLSGTDVIVACIDYRNYPKATISEMVQDASRGISFVCNNITEYGGDPNRIYLMGQSAGAHIAACALVEQAIKECDATQTTTWSVSQIKTYFGLSGGYNMFHMADHLNTRGPYKSLFVRMLGGEEYMTKYSPEIVVQDPRYMNAVSLLPQVILFHGTADYSIPADCRIGSEGWAWGPCPEPVGCRWTARAASVVRAGHRVPAAGWTGNGLFGGLPRASNSQLRTGTDKENPSVQLCALCLSKTFVESLQRIGVKAELKLYEGKTHTDVFVQDPMRGDDELFDDLITIIHAGDEEALARQAKAPRRCRLVPEFMLKLARRVSPF